MLLIDIKNEYVENNPRITSDSTRKHYRILVDDLTRMYGRRVTIDDLSDSTVAKYRRYLDDQGKSEHTIHQRLSYLRALWYYSSRKYRIPAPLFAISKRPDYLPTSFSIDEVNHLYRAIEMERGHYGGVPRPLWWMAFLKYCWSSGDRTGAILQLKWTWVDLDSGIATVPGNVRKSKKKLVVHLKDSCVDAFTKIRTPNRPLVFPFTKCIQIFYRDWRCILERANLPVEARNGPQKIRRTVVNLVDENGGDGCKFAQHSSRAITDKYYIDPTREKRPESRFLPDV